MGRYNFAPQKVYRRATQLLQAKRIQSPPPWYSVIATNPPSERLTRPPLQRSQKPGKKASRLFKPIKLQYEEDGLRWEYFNDHPWELARPRVLLEDDGRDHEKWDWSVPLDHALNRPVAGTVNDEGVMLDDVWDQQYDSQCARPINGEAVIQRQAYLLSIGHSMAASYDMARKEFYRYRHAREVESRVAREEALASGAFFGPGPNEVGMQLEDRQYDSWKAWAEKEITALKHLQGSSYTGMEMEEPAAQLMDSQQADVQEVSESIPANQRGQEALGGAAIHP
ncbi:Mitochondrial ribosomal protein S25 [Teratosphaeria destructans]|uniref:Small ribosomal subunit protein mS23 n=1 Tax=Teratosphaeria destructans TaxID=418781 RepID=A0A9W7SI79_9PEZI|nr:Mitochondrial ribosomal protein S25 [Teratosphaeria destructans]